MVYGKRYLKPESLQTTVLYLYILGATVLGLSALFGGGNLLLDPTGSTMNMPVEMLSGTPFDDYFVPGFILFSVFGVGSFVVLFGILRRYRWSWPAAVSLGGALVGWIVIQMFLIQRANFLHFVYGSLGILLVILSLSPPFRTELRW